MWRSYKIAGLFFLICFLLGLNCAFAQVNEEKEEKSLDMPKIETRGIPLRFFSSVAVFSGYDTNATLTPERKGDAFQEFLYSLSCAKAWNNGMGFRFNYDLDVLNYDQYTDNSNILNHFRFTLNKKLQAFEIGTGYDLGIYYYWDNEDGDLLFHKGFFYLRNNLSTTIYHQLMAEYGLKDYTHNKALADTIYTRQDKERVDHRQSIEYKIGCSSISRWYFELKGKFYVNDSNALYLDYYDYKAYEISPAVNYKLSPNLTLVTNFIYLRKNYKSRLVTLEDYKEKDNIYTANTGLRYRMNKRNTLSLLYTYRNDDSNDSLEKYNEHIISCGWQYNF